jgi:hypothetical protein
MTLDETAFRIRECNACGKPSSHLNFKHIFAFGFVLALAYSGIPTLCLMTKSLCIKGLIDAADLLRARQSEAGARDTKQPFCLSL